MLAHVGAYGRSHFNEVTLESSVAPSGRAAGLRPPKAIASIPIAKIEPRTAFALSHLSSLRGFQSLPFTIDPSLSEEPQRKLGFDPRFAGLEEILCAPDCVFPK
jgi:hypothetical protein